MNRQDLDHLISNLPQIPGISGKDEYFNSAVLVLLILIEDEYHLVFEKRSANIRQGGEICFPGGKFDINIDKDYKETAIRETVEELGIPADSITVLGCLDTIFVPTGVSVDAFCAIANFENINSLKINPAEVDRVFTIPVSYFINTTPELFKLKIKIHPSYEDEYGNEISLFPARELGLAEQYTRPWGSAINNVYVYKTKEGVIWGLTAKLIINLIKILKGKSIF